MKRKHYSLTTLAYSVAAALGVLSADAYAQIKTDGSLGKPAQTLNGPNYLIPQSLGKLVGSNLFQSFQTFTINTGESATFTTSTTGIANVISRVTGGSASQINGALTLTAASGTPNFFFINPAGVTFGAGAVVDVPGAFHVSTADYVKFPDGNFYADATKTSTFSSATPESFGFLGTSRTPITINGGASLSPGAGQNISIVAGDVAIDSASVSATGGNVRVAAVGQTVQEIPLTGALPVTNGNLTLTSSGNISQSNVAATDAGSINVSAGNITLDSGGYIASSTVSGSVGNAGNLSLAATGNLSIANTAYIAADTNGSGNAGIVNVSAGGISINTGHISANTYTAAAAGTVNVTAGGTLALNSAIISADTNDTGTGGGNAGVVNVNAGTLTVNSAGISAISNGAGNAGTVNVNANSIAVTSTGFISADALAASSTNGNAGSVNVAASNITLDTSSYITAGTANTANAGTVTVSASGNLGITNNAYIGAYNNGNGNAGTVNINAGNISMDSGGEIMALNNGFSGNAGVVNISTGNLSMNNGASIDVAVDNGTTGSGGTVKIAATGNLSINNSAAILADTYSAATAGSVTVVAAGDININNGSQICACTYDAGNAGSVSVKAGNMSITGPASSFTGIAADAEPFSTGNAGNVAVNVTGNLSIVNGGQISASSYSAGTSDETTSSAGFVTVNAGSLSIDGQGATTGILNDTSSTTTGQLGGVKVNVAGNINILDGGLISSSTYGVGNAGVVSINAANMSIGSQGSSSVTSTSFTGVVSDTYDDSGSAGTVNVNVSGNLAIAGGGQISSLTQSSGNAGVVNVNAGSLSIDGKGFGAGILSEAQSTSSGHGGTVNVNVVGNLSIVNAGDISSTAYATGNAGVVNVNAGSISIDGQGNANSATGISSQANSGTGNAGSVNVNVAGSLSIVNTGQISSSTFSGGNAGDVIVNAGSINLNGSAVTANIGTGIFSDANGNNAAKGGNGTGGTYSGQAGNVIVSASNNIVLNNAQIDVGNFVTVANPANVNQTTLSVSAPVIVLQNNSQISTISKGNVAASNIVINPSLSGGVVTLDNSEISSSFTGGGNGGNGGNISLQAKGLVMDSGFIQANTNANNAAGGAVNVNVQALVTSADTIFRGGSQEYAYQPQIFAFNVIQAAAPTGLSGVVDVTSPVLNLSGTLVGLNTHLIDAGGLGRNPCQIGGGSSLAQSGRGGFAPSSRDLLAPATNYAAPSVSSNAPRFDHAEPVLAVARWGCAK